ncbi:hypothetical protein ASH00_03890 [Arthrobacter sp. Soil782]|uniref:hypothetical protein n=1 Tax=Arthrobacter sp. Soil782 TaxID=1736410 RepID=UPI0006F7B115|nr:hypothetical protein [Arthrobacter sp. Soil782]KRF08833.1 hypothetical protein ASH00_03890 [Arthrobacter sp. Soil782]
MTFTAALIASLVIALVLAALHLAAPRIRKLPLVPESVTGSFAGGLAVAYVFLHLLPEIAEGNEAIGELLEDTIEVTPLFDLGIFVVALTGFTVFYGLDRLATSRRTSKRPDSAGVYWLHLGAFAFYNALITYTMALRVETGYLFAILFAIAMGLHFVLTDRHLEENYPHRFAASGRVVLAGALLLGWLLSALFAPTSTVVVAILTALLGGSVLLNVFKEELPSNRGSSFPWFLAGMVLYSVLLALITAAAE